MTTPRWTTRPQLLTLGFRLLLAVAVAALIPSASAGAGDPSSGPLVFAGAGSNLPSVLLLAEVFARVHPEIKIDVPESIGSIGDENIAGPRSSS